MKKTECAIKNFFVLLVETAIEDYMMYWRTQWPNESVTPKMHIMEEHVVPFIKKWKLGCGFYGEQGKYVLLYAVCNVD